MKELFEGLREYNLNEALSSRLWHARSYNAAYNILKDDTFVLSASVENEKDITHPNEYYYMSFMRSLGGSFTSDVYFSMDGDKLNQNYKGGPVNYFRSALDRPRYRKFSNEMEDRLVTNKPTIPNASVYITRIDIVLGGRTGDVKAVGDLAYERKIPCFVTEDLDFLIKRDSKNIIPFAKWEEDEWGGTSHRPNKPWKEEDQSTYKFIVGVGSGFNNLESILYASGLYRLDSDTLGYFLQDNRSNPDPRFKDVINIMRKNKIRSSEELFEFLESEKKKAKIPDRVELLKFIENGLGDLYEGVRLNMAYNKDFPEILIMLAKDKHPRVRMAVAKNYESPSKALTILANDEIGNIQDIARDRLNNLNNTVNEIANRIIGMVEI